MKKAKIMLAAIVVLAVGSGVFAANQKHYLATYFTNDASNICQSQQLGLVIVPGAVQTAQISDRVLPTECPTVSVEVQP